MRIRTMVPIAAVPVAVVLAFACDTPNHPVTAEIASPDFHVGCPAGLRFTGGGRVDPEGVGKTTFGFTVDGRDLCNGDGTPRGQIQVVHHPSKTLIHSVTIEHFASFRNEQGGWCGEWNGTARVKHVPGDWHEHRYFMEVCDNGEPGRGTNTFAFFLEGDRDGSHHNIFPTLLTGGNIVVHPHAKAHS